MSSPRRSTRRTPSKAPPAARDEDVEMEERSSELARPLPPSSSPTRPTAGPNNTSSDIMAPPSVRSARGGNPAVGGPGSVMISEIDLSSPLNYGTPSSNLMTPGTGRTPGSHSGSTPIRVRSDIGSDRRLRQVNVTPMRGQGEPASKLNCPLFLLKIHES